MRLRVSLLLPLLIGLSCTARATDNGGGGPGGGSIPCNVLCYLYYGSCTIPSGDPDIPPLKDPFCEERRNACIARCNGGAGGGGGGLVIGFQAPAAPMSPLPAPGCEAQVDG